MALPRRPIRYGCRLIEDFVHRRPRKSVVFYGPRVDQMGDFNPAIMG